MVGEANRRPLGRHCGRRSRTPKVSKPPKRRACMEKSIHVFFACPDGHAEMRCCQIWIPPIPQMEGPHFIFFSKFFQGRNFIFDFSTNPYPVFHFSLRTKPNRKFDKTQILYYTKSVPKMEQKGEIR